MVELKKEFPGPLLTQSALTQPIAKKLLYAHILVRNALLIKSEAVNK